MKSEALTINDLKPGMKVHYNPGYKEPENGVVKHVPQDGRESVFVVYHCANDWDNFNKYTGELTDLKDLRIGWAITQQGGDK